MTYDGFFRFGDTEIVNNPRALGLSRTARCPARWISDDDEVPGLRAWLGDDEYVWGPTMAPSPWSDPDNLGGAEDFLGIWAVDVRGLEESTFSAEVTQAAGRGGIVGAGREATRSIRFRVFLSATNAAGAEYGLGWLTRVLRGRSCSVHSSRCGRASLEWLQDRPLDAAVDDPALVPMTRYLHDVKLVTPPTIERKLIGGRSEGWSDDEGFGGGVVVTENHGYLVSFVLEAENPNVYSQMWENPSLDLERSFVADSPINLMIYPSAEALKPARVVVGRNYMVNPSAEVNASSIVGACTAVSGAAPTPFTTSTTIDDAAYGIRSAVGYLNASGAGATRRGRARMTLSQVADLTAIPDIAASATIWSKLEMARGSNFAVVSFAVYAEWLTAANAVVGGRVSMFSATSSKARALLLDPAGFTASRSSISRPAGAMKLRVATELVFDWSGGAAVATPTQVRFLADAFGAMVP